MVCFTMLSLQLMVGRLANLELERIDILSQYLPGGMTETMKTSLILPNISTEIQTWHLSNKILEL
jgi:hypothetical protein